MHVIAYIINVMGIQKPIQFLSYKTTITVINFPRDKRFHNNTTIIIETNTNH